MKVKDLVTLQIVQLRNTLSIFKVPQIKICVLTCHFFLSIWMNSFFINI